MKSMTGFGRAIAEHDGTRVIAEVRALNQRFFELKLAVPRGWGEHEAEIRKAVQSVVARGRVEIFIKSVALKPPPVRLEVNDRLANLYVGELRRLGKQLRLGGNPDIGSILNRPEIFHVVEEEHDSKSEIRMFDLLLEQAAEEEVLFSARHLSLPLEWLDRFFPLWVEGDENAASEDEMVFFRSMDGSRSLRELVLPNAASQRREELMDLVLLQLQKGQVALLPRPLAEIQALGRGVKNPWLRRLMG